MPVALERKLKKLANKKGFTGKRKNAYVYGALRNTGWRPKRELSATGSVPGDAPGSSAMLSNRLDRLIEFSIVDAMKRALEESKVQRKLIPGKMDLLLKNYMAGGKQVQQAAREKLYPLSPSRNPRPETRYKGMRSMSIKLDNLIAFGDPRERDNLGQFSNTKENVADSNTMAKTYGSLKQGLSLGGAAAIGGAGGVTGAAAAKAGGRALQSLYEKIKKSKVKV